MACKCCQQYAPRPFDGSAQPECYGEAKLKEARDLARLWHKRANDAGWSKPAAPHCENCGEATSIPPSKLCGECSAPISEMLDNVEAAITQIAGPVVPPISEERAGQLIADGFPMTAQMLSAEPSSKEPTNDEKLHARWVSEGKDLAYCQGPRRHFFVVDSPMYEQLLERGCFHCGAFAEVAL